MREITIKKNTLLYHGTDVRQSFRLPKAPAWYAWTFEDAASWIGWASKKQTRPRVITVRVKMDIRVADTTRLADWKELGKKVLDDTDPNIWGLAKAMKKSGLNGWLGSTEVMLSFNNNLALVSEDEIE